jgi:Fe-Mn family superoxide dismutase
MNRKKMYENYKKRLMNSLNETDVFDKSGKLLLSKGLKVKDKRSGYEYTVKKIINRDGEIQISLNPPDVPRIKPPQTEEPNLLNDDVFGNEVQPLVVPEKEFKKNFVVESAAPLVKDKIRESYNVEVKPITIKTETLSPKSIESHQKLMKNYAEALNKVSVKLDSVDKISSNSNFSDFRNLKLDESFNNNATFLHGLYFQNIGDLNSKITVDSISFMRIQRDFGTFEAWQDDFIACGMAARNGWVILGYNIFLKRYMNAMFDGQNGNVMIGFIPVLAIDMFEHSYFHDFFENKKEYLYKMMQEINWEVVENRILNTDQVSKIYGAQ